MGIFGFTGFKSTLGTALAVTLTSLLAWGFASSATNIEWLDIQTVESPIVASFQAGTEIPSYYV